MDFSIPLIRCFCILLSVFFFSVYSNTFFDYGPSWLLALIGATFGLIFGGVLIVIDRLIKQKNLRAFNLITIGLLCGYLMGEALMFLFSSAFQGMIVSYEKWSLIRLITFLSTSYLGMILTVRAADEWYLSIPFVRLKPSQQKKKDILLDVAILSDPRLMDLVQSGLLDQQLIVPRFSIKELLLQSENGEESLRTKARRSLDTLKKLEALTGLEMRYIDQEALESKDYYGKLAELATQLGAYILTADISKIQQSEMEGLKIININLLSHALKPLTSAGEYIQIKIQRTGKEPRQGVGYLDDGTMVVVNGGAAFLGETTRAVVLSVKGTSSGRIIFCNAIDQEESLEQANSFDLENSSRSYIHV